MSNSVKNTSASSRQGRIFRGVLYAVIVTALILGRAAQWVMSEMNVNLDEILFTLSNSLSGTDLALVWSFILSVVVPVLAVLFVLITFRTVLVKGIPGRTRAGFQDGGSGLASAVLSEEPRWKKMILRWLLPVIAAVSVIFCIASVYRLWVKLGVGEYLAASGEESTWIEDNYADPADVKMTFPEKKRNLIYLYLESMEVSYSDTSSGGIFEENYIPNLTKEVENGYDFSGPDARTLNGASSWKYTTWTMGGMFAATSGLPLKIPIEMDGVDTNYMSTQESFFPNIQTLGDILKEQGYENDILFGSDATFGGRRLYFSTHGDYQFYDYNHYIEDGELPSGYKVFWGFEDEKLFEFAKERLDVLSASDQPFNLTMLTVDTHYPNGYNCRLCEDTYDSSYANAIACSDRQVTEFLAWCSEQDWYEDTTIVVSGDHPTMATFCDSAPDDYVRKVYTLYLNAAKEPQRNEWREYSTVDHFPTTLSAMGVEIDGGRLGLGVDLFGTQDTLTEQMGRDEIDMELSKSSVWMEEQSSIKPLTADITYDPYDEENHKLSFTIRNVSSDKVDGFRCCMKMYGYENASGSDYIKWISAEEIEDGVWRAEWIVPTDHAYSGIVKLQPTCMVDGARSNVLDLHYYHLKYDESGENCEWYECDTSGRPLED